MGVLTKKQRLREQFLEPKKRLREERLKREYTEMYMADLIGLKNRKGYSEKKMGYSLLKTMKWQSSQKKFGISEAELFLKHNISMWDKTNRTRKELTCQNKDTVAQVQGRKRITVLVVISRENYDEVNGLSIGTGMSHSAIVDYFISEGLKRARIEEVVIKTKRPSSWGPRKEEQKMQLATFILLIAHMILNITILIRLNKMD